MQEITNPRIEKQKAEIEKTRARIADLMSKLREQEKHLRALEDMEIVARFRSELISDEYLPEMQRSDWDVPENEQEREVNDSGITKS